MASSDISVKLEIDDRIFSLVEVINELSSLIPPHEYEKRESILDKLSDIFMELMDA